MFAYEKISATQPTRMAAFFFFSFFPYWNLKIPDWLLGFIPMPSAMRTANFLQNIFWKAQKINHVVRKTESSPPYLLNGKQFFQALRLPPAPVAPSVLHPCPTDTISQEAALPKTLLLLLVMRLHCAAPPSTDTGLSNTEHAIPCLPEVKRDAIPN